ncbi:cytochrome P450 [Streptomyces sp. NPDC005336]|uniref:cytochrome P450 n=1 Tax=Streptomyces sp. NPDC005336 TaxID=3157035 RepID=UPI0033A18710
MRTHSPCALGLLGEMRDYWTDLAKERIRRPREDLMSRLVHAEVDGERLAIPEVCNIANRLLVAGHSSTDMLISNTVLSLDAFPEQRRAVSADRSLMPRVIEESLRYLSPISAVGRGTKVDAEVGGVVIPKDQMIMVWAAAANRDERQFKNPHAFDIMREEGGHLAFSRGVHFCLGRRLGRMEAQAAVGRLMDRFPKLRTDPDNPPEFFQFADATGVEKLPVLVR